MPLRLGTCIGALIFNMEIIDNVNKTLKYDMLITLHSGSKVVIAASCFSIYAFQEIKDQYGYLRDFTSPSFIVRQITAL